MKLLFSILLMLIVLDLAGQSGNFKFEMGSQILKNDGVNSKIYSIGDNGILMNESPSADLFVFDTLQKKLLRLKIYQLQSLMCFRFANQ
jgi:hypothetical protein